MIACRFVGSSVSVIGETTFDCVGQVAILPEKSFMEATKGGMALIPEKDFLRIGFTAEELAAYGPAGVRYKPTDAFNRKLASAQQVFRDMQRLLRQEGVESTMVSQLRDDT